MSSLKQLHRSCRTSTVRSLNVEHLSGISPYVQIGGGLGQVDALPYTSFYICVSTYPSLSVYVAASCSASFLHPALFYHSFLSHLCHVLYPSLLPTIWQCILPFSLFLCPSALIQAYALCVTSFWRLSRRNPAYPR